MNVRPRSKHTVTLPVPPSTNHLFVTAGRRRVKSPEYRRWRTDALALLIELKTPERFPIEVRVLVFGAVNTSRDLDNVLKPVGDSLVEAGVIPGDSIKYVTKWVVEYVGTCTGYREPCVDVYLTPRPVTGVGYPTDIGTA